MFVRIVEDKVTDLNSNHETYEAKEVGAHNGASVEFAHL